MRLTLLLCLLIVFPVSAQETPSASEGLIDLRSWDGQGTLLLNGDYEFYWQTHLTSREFLLGRTPPPEYLSIPGVWNDKHIAEQTLDGHGYGTYRLNLLLPSVQSYALKLPDIGTAYQLFIDGEEVVSIGQVGNSAESSKPRYYPTVVTFEPTRTRVELIFHVSNFHYRLAGIWLPIHFGTEANIERQVENTRALNMLLFGAIIIIGFYNLALFTLRRDDPSPLYLGIFCLLLSARLLSVDERYLTRLVELPFEWFIRVEYGSWMLALSAFAAYLRSTIPAEFPSLIAWFISIPVVAGVLFVLMTEPAVSSHAVPYFQLLTVGSMLAAVVAFVLAIAHKREGALLLTMGFAALFYTAANDILVNMDVIDTPLMLDTGLVVFIFLQSLLISYRFTRSFKMIEFQSASLRAANVRLHTQEKLRRHAEDEWEKMSGRIQLSQKMESIEKLIAGTQPHIAGIMKELPGAAGEKLNRLFTDFIIITGRHDQGYEPVDLNAVVQKYLSSDQGRYAMAYYRVLVHTNLADEAVQAQGSVTHLHRLLTGLVNFFVESERNPESITITTTSETTAGRALVYGELTEGTYAVLSVGEDDGDFDVPENLDHLFDPQSTLDNFDIEHPSLGMSVVWAIVQSHDGCVDIVFEESGGIRIDVYFPLVSVQENAGQTRETVNEQNQV